MGWLRRGDTISEERSAEPEPDRSPDADQVIDLRTTHDVRGESLLLSLADQLDEIDSGIDFIYSSLDRAASYCDAHDALLLVEEASLGRQAFRLGRQPIDGDWAQEIVRTGEPGLYLTPPTLDRHLAEGVASLCSVALRLDVSRHDSLHDPLTGLLNRRAFDDILEASAARAERYGWQFALVMIDIDHFKTVNDEFGHAAGDTVLRSVAAELSGRLRAGDAAARIGGDEFALILPEAGEDVVPQILSLLHRVAEERTAHHPLAFSAGAAIAPRDSTTPEALYRISDARLYENKQQR